LVKKVVAATIDSWRKTCADQSAALDFFAQKHPELARTDAEKSYNTGNLKAACEQVNPPAGMNGTALGAADPKQWDQALATLKKYGGLKTSQPASAFYTNQFLPSN
jgi:NitT/TauT family transport system substrate-binding protein